MDFFKKLDSIHRFPENYVVFDLETTGVALNTDLVCHAGYCVVENGKIVDDKVLFLNWPDSGLVKTDWLHNRILETRNIVESKGKRYSVSFDELRSKGIDPLEALRQYRTFLLDKIRNGYALVSHGGYNFDLPILKSNLLRYLDLDIDIGGNAMWDTGMIEKAAQLNVLPYEDDTLESFCKRVASLAYKGVFWSLDGHCIAKYKLDKKYNLSPKELHDARYDCYTCHLLFEEFKKLA